MRPPSIAYLFPLMEPVAGDPLLATTRALLESAKRDEPDADERARVWSRLSRELGLETESRKKPRR